MPISRIRPRRAWALVLAAVLVGTAGCCYSIRAPFDPSVRTVYVPVFRSITFRRDVNFQLTELVQKEIEKRTPFKVVGTPEGADMILDGEINFADKNIIVENPFNLPRQLTAILFVNVKWTHNPPLAKELTALPVTVSATVNFVPEVGETSMTAFLRANQKLAMQIVDMMEEPW
jgi:hypothetical protein